MTPQRLLAVAIGTSVLMGLAGCAGLQQLTADVNTHGQWPASLQAPRYVFERLPSQQVQPEQQARIEAAAEPALRARGFVVAARPEDAQVLVQVSVQRQTGYSWRDDPFYRPYDGHVFGNIGFGGLWGGRGGVGIGLNFDTPRTTLQVGLLVRDKASSSVLYEASASTLRLGSAPDSLMAPLFQAALFDFPAVAISPRRVTVPLAAPAASTASSPAASQPR
ncbi:DUF4136 domain-containing protein [Aquabacterium lacunae]|uniref:DUF4136 domain-containing protein n=1 Tax=Aquabacterium lacunae TaxID=2528630 RepID=A0A4Q9H4R4_9BURK|nr:DUF4136 domain-containing protein [Aquabacterium lacunae]TBO31219.1 DUF4136 domain-containing protein [Aquabacterium lacunae]